MKKFNEGDWFSLHKMTKDQQEWCLDNLKWLSEKGKGLCYQDKNLVPRYFSVNKGCFGGIWLHNADPYKELTFEDLYYGKEETKPMNLEKYSIEDLRRIRSNIDWVIEAVDAFNNDKQGVEESEESIRGFEGLELTKLARIVNTIHYPVCYIVESECTSEQISFLKKNVGNVLAIKHDGNPLLKVHFNDLFQYKTEDVKS